MNSSTKTTSLLAGLALLAATALAQSSTGSSIRPTTSGSARTSGSSNTSSTSNSSGAPSASNSSTTTTTTTTTAPNASANANANTSATAGTPNTANTNTPATSTTNPKSTPNTLNTPVLPASPGAPTATPHANDPLATDATTRSATTGTDPLTLTDAEKRAAEATRFKALDTDGDGRVSRAEYTLSSPRGLQGDSNVASDVTVRNSDAAFNARASSVEQFNQMDLNKDGFLSAEELAVQAQ